MIFRSKTAAETQKIAQDIAKQFKGKSGTIALIGELGAGKTTFTQGFAKGLGIKDKIISPTFILIRQHPLPSSTGGSKQMLHHVDLYRLEGDFQLGLNDLFNSEDLVLIEWADKIKDKLPANTTYITFKVISDSKREIEVRT